MTMIEKVLKNKEAVKRALQDEQEKAYNLYCKYYDLYGYLHHAVSTKDLHFLMSSVSIVTEFLDHCTVNVSSPSLRNNRQHLCNTAYLLLFNIADFSKISDYDKSSQLATVINVYKRLNSLKDLNAPN